MVSTWARRLIRQGWRSTLVLGLVVGLAAGCALTAWGAARRTAGAFDRAVAAADMPDLMLTFCPPDVETVDAESIGACFTYLPLDELAVIRGLPEVEAAGVGMFRGITLAPPDRPEDTLVTGSFDLDTPAVHSSDGQQLLVDGRWYRPGATDEIVLGEAVSRRTGWRVGDKVLVTSWSADELGSIPANGSQLHGPQRLTRVVGLTRGLLDLNASVAGVPGSDLRTYRPLGDPADPDFSPGFQAVLVRGQDGVDAETLQGAIEAALPDSKLQATPSTDTSELAPIREAIDYEASGALALAGLLGLAAAVFAGQAVARQSRREWADRPTLRALGMTDRQMRAAAALRGAATGAVAAAVGVGVALVASPMGPVGVARRTVLHHPIRADLVVLGGGAALTLLVVVAASSLLPSPARDAHLAPRNGRLTDLRLPTTLAAGVGMFRRTAGRSMPAGAAVTGMALAAATVVAAAALVASVDGLRQHPSRYGAPWDLSISAGGVQDDGLAEVAATLRDLPVDAAAGLVGSDLRLTSDSGRVTAWVQSFAPIDGLPRTVAPPVIDGRPPATDDEVALGTITLSDLDAEIGDVIELASLTTVGTQRRVTIVGTTMVNDNFETSPGRGAVVTPGLLDVLSPESTPDPYVVALLPGSDVGAARADLLEVAPGGVSAPLPQAAILNVDRLRDLPYLLAAVVALLAVASLAHALVLSVRRHRRPLAVLKSLGFTRPQVRRVVAVHATLLAGTALVVGIPLGVGIGRWSWRVVAGRLGVVDVAVLPVVVVLATAAAVVAVANLVALGPGWRAARTSTAAALQSE